MAPPTIDEAVSRLILSLGDNQKEQLLDVYKSGLLETILDMHQAGDVKPLVELRKRKPTILKNYLADSTPEEEPVLSYIQDLERRSHIFEEFCRISVQVGNAQKLNVASFSIVMVAPITILEERLRDLQIRAQNNDLPTIFAFFGTLTSSNVSGIQAFTNKGGRQPSSASTSTHSSAELVPVPSTSLKRKRESHERTQSGSSIGSQTSNPSANVLIPPTSQPFQLQAPGTMASRKPGRNRQASKLCKMRDNNVCLFTNMPDPEAAHIFPFGAAQHIGFGSLQNLLRSYWDNDQATEWCRMMKETSLTESTQNLISLNHQLHWWFDNGKMALKPLRKMDDGSVVVQFHWLKSHTLKSTTTFEGVDMSDRMLQAGLEDNSAWGDVLMHRKSGLPIETGQTFILKGNGPLLAPSFELLQLSWDLSRIVAISGAAEPVDLSDVDSGDEDIDEDNFDWVQQWVGGIREDEMPQYGAKSPS